MLFNKMKVIAVLSMCGMAAAGTTENSMISEHRCGVEASANPIHHNPWLVFVEYYRRGERYETRCGGTLISSRHVLTAAHCVRKGLTKNFRLEVRLGEYDLSSDVDCVGVVCAHPPVKIRVSSVTIHPLYDRKEHDIAIITLAQDAPYTDTIRPVCLPSSPLEEDAPFNAAGWGQDIARGVYSNIKKNLYLPYWSPERCQRAYANIPLPKHTICAGGEMGIDTCAGDSGGPLTQGKDRVELWGVTSTGNSVCGTKGYPGIYTSVRDHLEWIQKVIQE